MEDFLVEMLGRLNYLESQERTTEIEIRINEMTLAIVRIQQILLKKLKTT